MDLVDGFEKNLIAELRTFLRQPTARKWCHFEWFYSNIDKLIFLYEAHKFMNSKHQPFKRFSRNNPSISYNLNKHIPAIRTRRFSRTFLREERSKLRILQDELLSSIDEDYNNGTISPCIPFQYIPAKMQKGDEILAYIPKNKYIRDGIYLGTVVNLEDGKHTYSVELLGSPYTGVSIKVINIMPLDGISYVPALYHKRSLTPGVSNIYSTTLSAVRNDVMDIPTLVVLYIKSLYSKFKVLHSIFTLNQTIEADNSYYSASFCLSYANELTSLSVVNEELDCMRSRISRVRSTAENESLENRTSTATPTMQSSNSNQSASNQIDLGKFVQLEKMHIKNDEPTVSDALKNRLFSLINQLTGLLFSLRSHEPSSQDGGILLKNLNEILKEVSLSTHSNVRCVGHKIAKDLSDIISSSENDTNSASQASF